MTFDLPVVPTVCAPLGGERQEIMQRLSIVVPNYNYGSFVGEAVASALAVDWPKVEVIVVDDGSTDDSLDVLRAFGDKITLITQENSGPRVACNRGFRRSTGDVVIFLDSDDVLEPAIAKEVAQVWHRGVSKVQVQMRRIDRRGRSFGRVFPVYRRTPTPEQIRHWMTTTSAYPTPPGSGNIYSRRFLDVLFPLDGRCGDATDSACLAAAPYLGDVVTIPRALVRYRVHGNNRSHLLADTRRFTSQIERAYQRHRFAREVSGLDIGSDRKEAVVPLLRGRHLLQMRVAETRVCSGPPPIPGDSRARMTRDSIVSAFAPGPESVLHRLGVSLWCLTVLFVPAPVARRLVGWRFS
ncbi:MAG: glycosyltransferase [Pseudonocardia sp.]|nr:glycosyltransferase [Pseudonocardia sp.]